ncbi:hypothetical protein JCM6882_001510 [Rhodosporidiobolus microsporus]
MVRTSPPLERSSFSGPSTTHRERQRAQIPPEEPKLLDDELPVAASFASSDTSAGSSSAREHSSNPSKRQRQRGLPTAADLWVKDLPGLPADSKLALFAGNLPSTATSNPPTARDSDAHLYFLLARAKHLPKRERLVLWLNGGPGCSSFDGALIELGPLRITPEGGVHVVENTAWNEYANVLFLDQPAGTGFSYVTKNDNVRELADAADHVVTFLSNFYNIFPEFTTMDTYIAGESHAGQYIPYIADAILKTTLVSTRLKGLLIGNGWISPREQYPAYLDYLLDNKLVRKNSPQWRNLQAVMDNCQKKIKEMDDRGSGSKGLVLVSECEQILGAMSSATMKDGLCLNVYDTREYHQCGSEWPKDLEQVTKYLRRPDVIKALHAEDTDHDWVQCSPSVSAKFWTPNSAPSVMLLPALLEQMPVILYNGDRDLMCAGVGIEKMIGEMEWNGAKGFNGSEPVDWTVNGEFAGLWTTARNLTYVEFFNSSHMVPMDAPLAAHDMLLRFMQVDTLNAAGSAAKIPSRIGSQPEVVLGATHPNGSTLPGAEQLAAGADSGLDAAEGQKEGLNLGGGGAGTTEDGYKIEHELYYGPRRTAALVVLLVVVVGAVWAILRWRGKRRRERYRRLKGKGRASVPLEDVGRGGGRRGFRDDDGGDGGEGEGDGLPPRTTTASARRDNNPDPRPTEHAETVAVFDVGEEDSSEEEEGDSSWEKGDEESWGDLGRATGDAQNRGRAAHGEGNPWGRER